MIDIKRFGSHIEVTTPNTKTLYKHTSKLKVDIDGDTVIIHPIDVLDSAFLDKKKKI